MDIQFRTQILFGAGICQSVESVLRDLGDSGFESHKKKEISSSSKLPHHLWDHPTFSPIGTLFFPEGKTDRA
jgi:hypothetical protein